MTDSSNEPPGYDGMPRWVKAFVMAGVVAVLLLVIGMAVGSDHGPGQHRSDGDGRRTYQP